jgi:hypothetical protein
MNPVTGVLKGTSQDTYTKGKKKYVKKETEFGVVPMDCQQPPQEKLGETCKDDSLPRPTPP